MDRPRESLYDVLGVARDAKVTDIGRAYNQHKAAMRSESAPPDSRRSALLHEAFEVLSDPKRRAAYDASLRRDTPDELPAVRRFRRGVMAGIATIVLLVAVAGVLLWSRATPGTATRAPVQIQTAASLAVGRVQSIDIAGKASPIGIAFTVEEGVMMTACEGIAPNSQLVVSIPPRTVPARMAGTDRSKRFCRLEVTGAGSWPLHLQSTAPRAGDAVYAADLNAKGEVTLRDGEVKRVTEGPLGRIVETSLAVPPGSGGRPLLDAQGRVVGIAFVAPDGRGEHVGVAADWVDSARRSR